MNATPNGSKYPNECTSCSHSEQVVYPQYWYLNNLKRLSLKENKILYSPTGRFKMREHRLSILSTLMPDPVEIEVDHIIEEGKSVAILAVPPRDERVRFIRK